MPILMRFWREIILVLLGVALYLTWAVKISGLEKDLALVRSEKKVDEIQKEALRSAILDQNEAIESQRIDVEKRAIYFEQASKRIRSKYEATRAEVQNLSGDAECEAMRSIVRGAVK